MSAVLVTLIVGKLEDLLDHTVVVCRCLKISTHVTVLKLKKY